MTAARDLIIALRGGLPNRCNFCDQPTPPERLHPEEGGEWAWARKAGKRLAIIEEPKP